MHQYWRLRTKNPTVQLNQSDPMRRKEEKARVLEEWKRLWSQAPLSGHFGYLTNVVNPSRIDKSVDPETKAAHAEESEEKTENSSEKEEDSGEGENESREGG